MTPILRRITIESRWWAIALLIAFIACYLSVRAIPFGDNWYASTTASVALIVGLCRVGLWYGASFWRWYHRPAPADLLASTSDSPVIRTVIGQLRSRANRLRVVAGITLVIIIGAIAGGLSVFSRAEQSASNIEVERENLRVLEIVDRIADTRERVRLYTSMSESSIDPKTSAEDQAKEKERKDEYLKRKKLEEERLQELQKLVTQKTAPQRSDTVFLTSLLSTKIGSAVTLLFLVQILVTLYRYNTRLASFYDARADALQICGLGANDNLTSVTKLLGADILEFGKTPSSPFTHAMRLAKDILSLKAGGDAT
jgi:hypothetical protein